MNNFSIIKSHLEYGHKVEVQWKDGSIPQLFIGIDGEVLVSSSGYPYYSEDLNVKGIVSITPIPHRYKKLEVGMKVDVLPEYNNLMAKCGTWMTVSTVDEKNQSVDIRFDTDTESVPLWAITPHVEEEKGIPRNSKKIELIDLTKIRGQYMEGMLIKDGVSSSLVEISRALNEVIEHINLQGTNN